MALKLTEVAKAVYNSNLERHANYITREIFKQNFLHRFRDVRNDQYHFIKVQKARQKPDESPQEFADGCRSLALKTVPKVDNHVLQKFYFQQTKIMLFSTFFAGLIVMLDSRLGSRYLRRLTKPFRLQLRYSKRRLRKKK